MDSEKDFAGKVDGFSELSESPRLNVEAIEDKKMEYLLTDVNDVLVSYDQSVITRIAKAFDDDFESDPEARSLLEEFVNACKRHISEVHGTTLDDYADEAVPLSVRHNVLDRSEQVNDTYSREDIIGVLSALLNNGYISK